MKIKQEKQFTLPQLIEWASENDVRNRKFFSKNDYCIGFDAHGFIYFNSNRTMPLDQSFTVEVEEEITEDTEIPKLMTTFKKTCLNDDFGYQRVRIDENYKIKLMLNRAEAHRESVESLHIVNDDGTHTLIWRDGKIVE